MLPLLLASAALAQSVPTTPAAAAPEEEQETIVLSPFDVVSDATGYFQSNTMSGTRLNSKIEDLGQSITVMTKEQMTDFAMLDINDVFDYMASTEGTSSYSDFVLDRTGAVTDNVAFDPNNANRVRGIGKANIAFNNIQTSGRVPLDPLWLDSLELSRGPNANIFGLGEAAGTVNQVPATANLSRDFTRAEARVDSYGGWRVSLDVNRMLVEDKLALRASFARQHTAFERKPSGEYTNRTSLQFKAKPFKNTTVSLSWFGYDNAARRPNFTTPRDNISAWLAAGQPAWDPITRLITLNGTTYGLGAGNTLSATSTTPITDAAMPSYFRGGNGLSEDRSFFRVGNGAEEPYWSIPRVTNATTPAANPVANNIRFVATAPVNQYGGAQPLFASYAAVGDKSIYDWEEYNLLAHNTHWNDVDTYLAQLDQVFFSTPNQTLAAQVTFMREDAESVKDMPLGPASVNGIIGELYADPNTRNLDGTPNPYFGRPYLRSKEPYQRKEPLLWDTMRGQAAYELRFTENDNWTRWLGSHQLLGYYEYKDQQNRNFAWRRTAKSRVHPWELDQVNAGIVLGHRGGGLFNPATGASWPTSHNHMRVYEFYYVGDTPGGGIEYSPSPFPEGATVPFVWGNTGNFRYDPTAIGYTASADGSQGGRQTIVRTYGGVLQSNFLDGRLITTFGQRKDKITDRNKVEATLTPDLTDFDYGASSQWRDSSTWRGADGPTSSFALVARPFRDLGVLKDQMNGGGGGRFLAEALSSLSLTYNKSDSFIPQGPAVDLFLRDLPNQTGHVEEYGFWMSFFEGKLSLRYNHHETLQKNKRDGDVNTIAQRTLRADGILNSTNADPHNLESRAGDPSNGWVTQLNPGWSAAQVDAEVSRIMGLTTEFRRAMEDAGDDGRIAATQDITSNGDELEVYYNPSPEWTISGSVTRTETINTNAGSTVEDWLESRLPIWNAVEDPRFSNAAYPEFPNMHGPGGNLLWRHIAGAAFTTYGYHATNSALANYAVFVEGPVAVFRQLEGRPRPQVSKYVAKFNTRYRLSGLTDHEIFKNMTIGGSVRWADEKAIGFLGVQSLPDTIRELDTSKPVFTPSETYVDLFVSYRTRIFNDKIRANFQLNAKNVTESGGSLLVTQVFPDGSPLAYRIVDPRQFILSCSFEF